MLAHEPGDSFLQYAAALEYHKAGNEDRAIELFETLRTSDPQYLGTYYQLGKLYENRGLADQALAIYRQGKEIARQQNDHKTLGELSEAEMLLEDDD